MHTLEPTTDIGFSPLAQLDRSPSQADPDDRRGLERRGTLVRIIRFNGDRRICGDDRRQRARRGFLRSTLNVSIDIRHGGQSKRFDSADISVLGVSLHCAPPIPLGALVRLTFSPPDDLAEFPIVSWAQVVSYDWDREILGFKFVGMRACDTRRMGRFLAQQNRADGQDELAAPYRF